MENRAIACRQKYPGKQMVFGTLLLLSLSAHADWLGKGEVGAVSARGNTHTDTANAKLDIANEVDVWKHSAYLAGLYGSNNEINSANRWETRWQSDYNFTERTFWFGGARYERDHFGAFSYQESLTTGIGYKFFDTDTTKLTAQIGPGIKRSQEQTVVTDDAGRVIDRIEGDTTTRGLISLSANYEHKLTATTSVTDKFLVETASDNTLVQNDLALQVAINEHFALSLGYGLRENTSPPAGSERIDTVTTMNLVYNFK